MSKSQRYVSDELTHFVGRGLPDDEAKYELLIKIIKSGWLTHPPHDSSKSERKLSVRFDVRIDYSALVNTNMVCFCDIPSEDFYIHMEKYSKFGLSFARSFMVARGANPVFYVANNSRFRSSSPLTEHAKEPPFNMLAEGIPSRRDVTRSEFFNEVFIEFSEYMSAIQLLLHKDTFDLEARLIGTLNEYIDGLELTTEGEVNREKLLSAALGILDLRKHIPVNQRYYEILDFIFGNIFSFIKMFDDSKAEGDPDNFYMEREWRVLGNVPFDVDDVRRIIVPEPFAKRLRVDLPAYCGQVSFA